MPDRRLRALLVVGGLLVLLANVSYYALLLHTTRQDVHHMWFRADFRFFNGETGRALRGLFPVYVPVAVLGLLLGMAFQRGLGRRRIVPAGVLADEAHWSVGLAWLVILGVFGCGIAVSLLVAPSFSDRNLLIDAPFAWLLLARLHDAAGPRPDSRGGKVLIALIVLLVGIHLVQLKGRLLPRQEPWRQSAAFVRQHFPACLGQTLPVLFPFKFGPPVALFDRMAERISTATTCRRRARCAPSCRTNWPAAILPRTLAPCWPSARPTRRPAPCWRGAYTWRTNPARWRWRRIWRGVRNWPGIAWWCRSSTATPSTGSPGGARPPASCSCWQARPVTARSTHRHCLMRRKELTRRPTR